MAINWKRTQPQEQAFAMAPMVDMVFLLLVFFMCVTAVSSGRSGARIELPPTSAASAGAANTASASANHKAIVVLNLTEGGELTVNGTPCEPAQLLPLLRQMRTTAKGEISVRVRAHVNAPYQEIEPLLAACSLAGISRVSYAAFEAKLEPPPAAPVGRLDASPAAPIGRLEPSPRSELPTKCRAPTHRGCGLRKPAVYKTKKAVVLRMRSILQQQYLLNALFYCATSGEGGKQ